MIETSESLTLDTAARERAERALRTAFQDARGHFCQEWMETDVCTICWNITADVIRAAEGLRLCSRCNGGGTIAPGDCCPECGGDGLEPDPAASSRPESSQTADSGEEHGATALPSIRQSEEANDA